MIDSKWSGRSAKLIHDILLHWHYSRPFECSFSARSCQVSSCHVLDCASHRTTALLFSVNISLVPLLLNALLKFLEWGLIYKVEITTDFLNSSARSTSPLPKSRGYALLAAYIVVYTFIALTLTKLCIGGMRAASSIRAVLLEATFRKGLRAHLYALQAIGSGRLSSHVSVDVERITGVGHMPYLAIATAGSVSLGLVSAIYLKPALLTHPSMQHLVALPGPYFPTSHWHRPCNHRLYTFRGVSVYGRSICLVNTHRCAGETIFFDALFDEGYQASGIVSTHTSCYHLSESSGSENVISALYHDIREPELAAMRDYFKKTSRMGYVCPIFN